MTTAAQKPSKDSIIEAYRDLISNQGGTVVGEDVFKRETGISPYYRRGGYWRSWAAFQADAGYAPNIPTQKVPDEILLHHFAQLALERNSIPTQSDLILKRREDPTFPDRLGFSRFGNKDALLAKVTEYCKGKTELLPVLKLLKEGISSSLNQRLERFSIKGFVYLLRSGKKLQTGSLQRCWPEAPRACDSATAEARYCACNRDRRSRTH